MPKFENNLINNIKLAVSKQGYNIEEVSLEINTKSDRPGDLCTSIACHLASKHNLKSSSELAATIVNELKENKYLASAKAEENGFINLTLSNLAFQEYYESLINNTQIKKNKFWKYLEIISANPTGYLHIGHARHGILTDTLGNIFEKAGYSVRREYLVNNAGNQIKELTKSFWRIFREKMNLTTHDEKNVQEDETVLYKGIDMYECLDYILKKNPQLMVGHHKSMYKCPIIKQQILDYFLDHIKALAEKYKLKIDFWKYESDFVNYENINRVIREVEDKLKHEDQALWLNIGEDPQNPKYEVLIKGDGHHTYFLQDMIYHDLKLRMIGEKDEIVNVLGCDHYGHIDKLMGYLKARNKGEEKLVSCICMQLVKLLNNGEAIKMSKRNSTVILMRDLEKYMSYEEVRWFFISQPATSTLEINLEKLKSQDKNNPVYYVMYAFSRICKILEKTNIQLPNPKDLHFKDLSSKERELFNLIMHFNSTIIKAAQKYAPHNLPQYLFKLAQVFHSYYEETPILKGEEQLLAQRVVLLKGIQKTIKEGLELMRIKAQETL